jgi:hypothetical protein
MRLKAEMAEPRRKKHTVNTSEMTAVGRVLK